MFDTIGIIILSVLVLAILAALRVRPIAKVLSHWHLRFETVQFSPEEFYVLLQQTLQEKELSKVKVSQIDYAQGGFLSPKRKYLRVGYEKLVFDVCAAPFAKEFFVSWWFGELNSSSEGNIFMSIPIIGKYFKPREKSFYEIDTETMFKESVSQCVKITIEQLTATKGMRNLSGSEWKEHGIPAVPALS